MESAQNVQMYPVLTTANIKSKIEDIAVMDFRTLGAEVRVDVEHVRQILVRTMVHVRQTVMDGLNAFVVKATQVFAVNTKMLTRQLMEAIVFKRNKRCIMVIVNWI